MSLKVGAVFKTATELLSKDKKFKKNNNTEIKCILCIYTSSVSSKEKLIIRHSD